MRRLLFVVALLVMPWARAEEPAYWPPCGEPGADPRCPPDAPVITCPGGECVVWQVDLDTVSWRCLPCAADGGGS